MPHISEGSLSNIVSCICQTPNSIFDTESLFTSIDTRRHKNLFLEWFFIDLITPRPIDWIKDVQLGDKYEWKTMSVSLSQRVNWTIVQKKHNLAVCSQQVMGTKGLWNQLLVKSWWPTHVFWPCKSPRLSTFTNNQESTLVCSSSFYTCEHSELFFFFTLQSCNTVSSAWTSMCHGRYLQETPISSALQSLFKARFLILHWLYKVHYIMFGRLFCQQKFVHQ